MHFEIGCLEGIMKLPNYPSYKLTNVMKFTFEQFHFQVAGAVGGEVWRQELGSYCLKSFL